MATLRYEVEDDNGGTVQCTHLDAVRDVEPSTTEGCEECLKLHMTWVHLRECLSCGHVGCCDNSPGQHATGHWHETSHPVMRSFQPGEEWGWCYPDELVLVPVTA
jgi:uncharacterized UBP type Zn finger protein